MLDSVSAVWHLVWTEVDMDRNGQTRDGVPTFSMADAEGVVFGQLVK